VPIERDLASVLSNPQQFFADDWDDLAVLDKFEQVIEKGFDAAVQHLFSPVMPLPSLC
jgi:hypothetical protein